MYTYWNRLVKIALYTKKSVYPDFDFSYVEIDVATWSYLNQVIKTTSYFVPVWLHSVFENLKNELKIWEVAHHLAITKNGKKHM